MKKSVFRHPLLACLFTLAAVFQSCTEVGEGKASLTIIGKEQVGEIPAEGATVTLSVEWSNCKWKISQTPSSEGQSIATNFSPVYAGSVSTSGTTKVTFEVKANSSTSSRTILISVNNVDGNEYDEVTIVQKGVTVPPVKVTTIDITPSKVYQTIDGFGAMNNWGDNNYWTAEECKTFFKTLNLNIMRVRISPTEANWKNLLTCCKLATGNYGVKILASPWTMPAAWKDTGTLNATDGKGNKSHLKPENYKDYAEYLTRFVKFMSDGSAPIYAVSVQNEPDWPASYEGCIWSAEQHLDFLKSYGELITGAKVCTGESLNTSHSFYDPALNDEKACAAIDIVGGHLYGVKPQSYTLAAQKGKRLWMTEHLYNDSWTNGTDHWEETMTLMDEICDCMTTGWNAYILWYGKRYYALMGDGEQGTTSGSILQRGYAFGQFSKYVSEGDVRIGASVTDASAVVRCCAFKRDSRITVVMVNDSASTQNVSIVTGSSPSGCSATVTSSSDNWSNVPTAVEGESVTLSLKSKSITTLVFNI